MLVLGLTGGIATGKSTVSSMLGAPPYSFPIIDADEIAREVVFPGTSGYKQIVAYFGPKIPDLLLDPDNQQRRFLNRPALGRYVFGNDDERKVLNHITHPQVRRSMLRKILVNWLVRGSDIVILDIPLLFEARFDMFCGKTLVVACAPETQRERLLKRDGGILSEKEAEQRIDAQMSIEKKAWLADIVIWNDEDLDELKHKVNQVVAQIQPSKLRTWIEWVPPIGALMALLSLAKKYFSDTERREKMT
ncbi:dephospho-CoA kinase-domain-containing protein [Kockiozyma suomiensis]|uniref:dephospho-CoA kinase-domain-containing protein n=1 Tax=Kockiozyma suomiensis TaxID=1337062 RepID=UPI00334378F1